MDWTCSNTEERLSDYLDGLLGSEERREFDAHANGCAHCAPLVRNVGSLVGRLRSMEQEEPPPQLVRNILDQTLGPRTNEKQVRAGWRGWLQPAWHPRFVMGAVTVMATFLFIFQAMGVQPGKLTAADFSPASVYRSVNRRAHLVYGRSVKFVNDLRVVYEIQTRLRTEPSPVPVQEPETEPAPANPQQKSEHDSKPGRTENRDRMVFAVALSPIPRSLP